MTHEQSEYVGEWVRVKGFDRQFRIVELGLGEERIQEVIDSGGLTGMTMPKGEDQPYDLLQNIEGYMLVSRDEWYTSI